MLGMLDTVHEIALCKQFEDLIYSWDSATAVWNGINWRFVQDMTRKYKEEVDFEGNYPWTFACEQNTNYMEGLIR